MNIIGETVGMEGLSQSSLLRCMKIINSLEIIIIIRFLFTVVSCLLVSLVYQVTGPRATTINTIRTIDESF